MVRWELENLRLSGKHYYLFGGIRVWKKNYVAKSKREEKNG